MNRKSVGAPGDNGFRFCGPGISGPRGPLKLRGKQYPVSCRSPYKPNPFHTTQEPCRR